MKKRLTETYVLSNLVIANMDECRFNAFRDSICKAARRYIAEQEVIDTLSNMQLKKLTAASD